VSPLSCFAERIGSGHVTGHVSDEAGISHAIRESPVDDAETMCPSCHGPAAWLSDAVSPWSTCSCSSSSQCLTHIDFAIRLSVYLSLSVSLGVCLCAVVQSEKSSVGNKWRRNWRIGLHYSKHRSRKWYSDEVKTHIETGYSHLNPRMGYVWSIVRFLILGS